LLGDGGGGEEGESGGERETTHRGSVLESR
jgi:hypothetical protein